MLPPGFEKLVPYIGYWDVPTMTERWERRATLPMEDIRRFYEDMLEHGGAAMDLIALYPMDDMPEDVGRLARLMLAFMSAAVAVEVVGAPRDPFSPYPHNIRIVRGPAPWG
ncbi:hypothetical protein [Sphingobium aquiterrae]|uniref:hypothetical protein n=1 Tax=Sphingobium aquiterrae TaxID=2038656 RepID=UPI003017BA82